MGNFLYNIGSSLLSVSIHKMLLGAGLTLASYSTISTMLDTVISDSIASMQGGDAIALAFLGISGMDTALSLVFSGVLVRATMSSYSLFITKLT